jgi:group I intron endonuclease
LAYIYCIKNKINGKCYVGKTLKSPKERFSEHLYDAYKPTEENRPLYRAIKKYGKDNFSLHVLEECTDGLASEREIWYIKKLKTYAHGYNATIGGDGKQLFDHNVIKAQLEAGLSQKLITELNGCSIDLVRQIRLENSIPLTKIRKQPSVVAYTEDETEVGVFISAREAFRFLREIGITDARSDGGTHINAVCNGRRKVAYGFKWKYIN